jgi:transketolase
MQLKNKIPCRKAFSSTILEEAQLNRNIFVITSDSRGSATLEDYAVKLPDQFLK